MPLPSPPRDPRSSPVTLDRVLMRSEGTARIVVGVSGDQVVWRFEGGTVKRTVTLVTWRSETQVAEVVHRA